MAGRAASRIVALATRFAPRRRLLGRVGDHTVAPMTTRPDIAPASDAVLAAFARAVAAACPGLDAAGWQRLSGGRSNRVYRAGHSSGPAICKVYGPGETPLFPNRPADETQTLRHLAGSGLAPALLASGRTGGQDWIVYRMAEPAAATPRPAHVARALGRLHTQPAPAAGSLRRLTLPRARAEALAALAGVPDPQARAIAAREPACPALDEGVALLHGDPVPGNIVPGAASVCFIDWQCPALGDPLFDIALYLSPAMQTVHAGQPLSPADEAAFRDAYPDRPALSRLDAARPLLTWRMMAYCAWKIARGDLAYAPGLEAESALLQQLEQPDRSAACRRAQHEQRDRPAR